jgi:hypothetical protein
VHQLAEKKKNDEWRQRSWVYTEGKAVEELYTPIVETQNWESIEKLQGQLLVRRRCVESI